MDFNLNAEIHLQIDPDSTSIFEGVVTGLIGDDPTRELSAGAQDFTPRLITNQPGDNMEDALCQELQESETFDISVAFVSAEALLALFQEFKNQKARPGSRPGRIITSTKNYFNPPRAFWELLRLKDVTGADVRVWQGEQGSESEGSTTRVIPGGQPFHPKGYIFAKHLKNGKPYYDLYIGSSNLTQQALTNQREWNLRLSSLDRGALIDQISREINRQVAESQPLTEDWIKQYEEDFRRYAPPRKQLETSRRHRHIRPNSMQRKALKNLKELRARGEHRAIIISATGTGKTFLSALDVKQVGPAKMLYLAQQEQILTKAQSSYQEILGCPKEETGLFTGRDKKKDSRYLFATVQTMSRPDILKEFPADAFDYILIDEVHHAGAKSYQAILDHFSAADFILGMTATPERTDGFNIFELFGYNVAYEIRLQKALDEGMLCPFHYYGVTEYLGSDPANGNGRPSITVDDGTNSRDRGQLTYEIGQLTTPGRVRYIIDVLQQYSPYHQQITGLVFCSRREEAQQLSELFNREFNQQAERNYRTQAVTGDTPVPQRDKAIQDLENGDLDYIFTVDLFNEGIDIPALNQIVMLRNTQSSIVFTQQLGRGLRLYDHKESVVVIDFIGNYTNNYLIPVALYGNTGDRDMARRNLQRHTIGLSSISFDPIARTRILRSLDTADWSAMKKLTEAYRQLRFQLGRIPMLTDVHAHDPSLTRTMAAKLGDYHSFVRSRERNLGKDATPPEPVSPTETGILKMATEVLLPGLRPQELVILEQLCQLSKSERANTATDIGRLKATLTERFPQSYRDPTQMASALRVLDGSYFTPTQARRFGGLPLISRMENGSIRLNSTFAGLIEEHGTFRNFFVDTLKTGLLNCQDALGNVPAQELQSEHGFLRGRQYTMAEAVRLLGWNREVNGQSIGGYMVDQTTGSMPIFIKYANSQYQDQFLSDQTIRWFSKNHRRPESREFRWMRQGLGQPGWQETHFIPLFVMRRQEAADRRYYYLGHVTAIGPSRAAEKPGPDGKGRVPVTITDLSLDRPVDHQLYRHLLDI
ncbi:DUF3427 domain-containing protein [Bifidobacterium asteroides]|uniref:RNA helicase n=1 Tax=Bifidobacterium asteroides TaxID=1684 RepID=A0A2N3RCZ4_9BIFI|nr:DUF3427 domain-containing protein [Bifidobacterium asteroides]PKV10361.1 RNA helicase [Bifidobacterium asteroides]